MAQPMCYRDHPRELISRNTCDGQSWHERFDSAEKEFFKVLLDCLVNMQRPFSGSLNGKFVKAILIFLRLSEILFLTNNQTLLDFQSNLNHGQLNSESDGLCSQDASQIGITLLEGATISLPIANWLSHY